MGKIILEFDSNEESQDARVALDGHKWKNAMWELDQKLRDTTKYGKSVIHTQSEAPGFEQDIAEKYREMIREVLSQYNLNLED
jgi:hypothetical protein